MPYSDPDRQRTAVREAMRSARGSVPAAPPCEPLAAVAEGPLEAPADVVRLLAAAIRDVAGRDIDPVLRCRTIAFACQTLLKGFEVADIDEELRELRELVERQAETAGAGGRWPR